MSRVRIVAKSRRGPELTGQDMRITVVGRDGVETVLPAVSAVITCDGRRERILATLVLVVDEVDVEAEAPGLPEVP